MQGNSANLQLRVPQQHLSFKRELTSSNEEKETGHAVHEPSNVSDLLAPAQHTLCSHTLVVKGWTAFKQDQCPDRTAKLSDMVSKGMYLRKRVELRSGSN